MHWLSDVGDWVVGLAQTPWVYVATLVLATIDGFFPPVPSESVVIALASLSLSTGHPMLWLVGIVAAVGAFCGDQIAYSIGKRVDLTNRRFLRGERAQRTLRWAEHALAHRGAVFILAARYIPVGRVAVNMTAGSLHYPRRRFTALVAIAAVTWSAYTVLLGTITGQVFKTTPWLGVVVGVAGGIALGMIADPIITWVGRRFGVLPDEPAAAGAAKAGTPALRANVDRADTDRADLDRADLDRADVDPEAPEPAAERS